ncbi:MAG: exopolysaccharide Pel transporter PelG [Pseudomonadota bacterium]
MAGIGFQLARMAREGGVGGIVGAAVHGAAISAGPWLITAAAVTLLEQWSRGHLGGTGVALVQTVLVYAFSLSAVIAAPIGILATRLVADALYAQDPARVPAIVGPAFAIGGGLALIVGAALFGGLVGLPFWTALLAAMIFALLAQIWIAAPLLTAVRRYGAVLAAYLSGVAVTAVAIALPADLDGWQVLLAVALGLVLTLAVLVRILLRRFPALPTPLPPALIAWRQALLVGGAGLMGVVAIWIDKWMLWFGSQSIVALAPLQLNPVNDLGSFLGLLTIVPGLTLMLIVTETRFDRAFGDLLARCTGTSRLTRIDEARGQLIRTMIDSLRLLVIAQMIVAATAWVLAVPFFDLVHGDIRAIFAFRQTAFGAVFHLIAIACTVALAYFNMFGRILAIWSVFAATSAVATWLLWDAGFGVFGWGYLSGAVMAASVGIALVANASVNLIFMLFVGNNPAVVGPGGRLL